MLNKIVLASANKKKINELQNFLEGFEICSYKDIGYDSVIDEPYYTFQANALQKAKTIYNFCKLATLSDDSGICVEALHGKPGIHSARYAGIHANDNENLLKLLNDLEGVSNRNAYYKVVICLIYDEKEYFFDGECHGSIAIQPSGIGGFGYDPIFIPNGYKNTFAELPAQVKQEISHRAIAMKKLKKFILEIK